MQRAQRQTDEDLPCGTLYRGIFLRRDLRQSLPRLYYYVAGALGTVGTFADFYASLETTPVSAPASSDIIETQTLSFENPIFLLIIPIPAILAIGLSYHVGVKYKDGFLKKKDEGPKGSARYR